MKSASLRSSPSTLIDSLLINPLRVPLPKTISTDFPISLKELLSALLYRLLFWHPISLHYSDAIQVNADPVSKMTSNAFLPEALPTCNSPINIVLAIFVNGTSAIYAPSYILLVVTNF